MNIVQLDRISKTYDTKVAVDALSLEIEAGKMFGLLGPNGAGKTSTIRMMIGSHCRIPAPAPSAALASLQ